MSEITSRRGVIPVSPEILLDLLCLDHNEHRVVFARMADDGRTIEIGVIGPTMPDTPIGEIAKTVIPVYRTRNWDLVEVKVDD